MWKKETKEKNNQEVHLDIAVAKLHGMVVWNKDLLSLLVCADNTRCLVLCRRNGSVSWKDYKDQTLVICGHLVESEEIEWWESRSEELH